MGWGSQVSAGSNMLSGHSQHGQNSGGSIQSGHSAGLQSGHGSLQSGHGDAGLGSRFGNAEAGSHYGEGVSRHDSAPLSGHSLASARERYASSDRFQGIDRDRSIDRFGSAHDRSVSSNHSATNASGRKIRSQPTPGVILGSARDRSHSASDSPRNLHSGKGGNSSSRGNSAAHSGVQHQHSYSTHPSAGNSGLAHVHSHATSYQSGGYGQTQSSTGGVHHHHQSAHIQSAHEQAVASLVDYYAHGYENVDAPHQSVLESIHSASAQAANTPASNANSALLYGMFSANPASQTGLGGNVGSPYQSTTVVNTPGGRSVRDLSVPKEKDNTRTADILRMQKLAEKGSKMDGSSPKSNYSSQSGGASSSTPGTHPSNSYSTGNNGNNRLVSNLVSQHSNCQHEGITSSNGNVNPTNVSTLESQKEDNVVSHVSPLDSEEENFDPVFSCYCFTCYRPCFTCCCRCYGRFKCCSCCCCDTNL